MVTEMEGIKMTSLEGPCQTWTGPLHSVQKGSAAVREALAELASPVFVVGQMGMPG